MKVYLHLNEEDNPMEYTETDDTFITVPIGGIESIEIKEK